MRSASIRLIIILKLVISAGILVTQVYWMQHTYSLKEQEFNLKVNLALRHVSELQPTGSNGFNTVERISPEYYIVPVNAFIDKASLQSALEKAFAQQELVTDFEYAFYTPAADSFLYQNYVHDKGLSASTSHLSALPRIRRDGSYIGVFFPNRTHFLSSGMIVWALATLGLGLLVLFLGYLLIIIFKQRRLSEVQKDFVSNMTHEFKTPLSSIRLASEVLMNPAIIRSPQRLMNYAAIIYNESGALSKQVERALHVVSAEKGELQLNKESFSCQELIEEVVKEFNGVVTSKSGKIELHFPDNQLIGNGDINHLKNVLRNLIDNAIKYCHNPPEIHIFLQNLQKEVCIEVHDNGIGIDKQQQKLLFRKFYRVPTGNVHDVKGFGLGLSYVHAIVKAQGGNIRVESRPAVGTRFVLSFPTE